MGKFVPKFFSAMKNYTANQFVKDIIAGVIVAIIALPLSIALAIASGVNPERGIYTAIIAGFVISFLGGSRVQISGPTAAFATIVAGIVAKSGTEGLLTATIIAGVLLIIMGFLKLGSLIKYIPYTITTGFTAGIAITLVIGQMKDFLGLTFQKSPIETMEKVEQIGLNISTINFQALVVGAVALVILIIWPKIKYVSVVPASLVAILVTIAIVLLFKMDVNTIGGLYTISNDLPQFEIPDLSLETIQKVFPDAVTIAVLAGIESLLSCVVADGMIGSRHSSNMELVAQGAGNIFSAFFGGIPATGAIARTAANIKNGGRTPVAGMVHAIVLLLILVVLMPYASLIPMPSIAAILIMVAYNMSGWKQIIYLVKTSPKSDIIVLFVTLVCTVVFDLVVAIEIGVLLAVFLFMKRMSQVAEIKSWKYLDDETEDKESINLMQVPRDTFVYEIIGPVFFAATDKFLHITENEKARVIVLRMRAVPAIDASGIHALENVIEICKKRKVQLVFSHVNEQPYSVLKKAGIIERIGKENFCDNIADALDRADRIVN